MKSNHEKAIRKFTNGEIYLHGSRRMAERLGREMPKDTDYDYAVDYLDSPALVRAFDLGWVECVDKSYTDENTSVVIEKYIDGDKVQVSSRFCLHIYKDIFESIDPQYYFDVFRKDKTRFREWLLEQYPAKFDDLPF